jgi:hypothetical protein
MTKNSTDSVVSGRRTWFVLLTSTIVMLCTTVTADHTEVCTIDASGQETCVVDRATTTTPGADASLQSGQLPLEEICLPDGHCWDGLETALSEHFSSSKEEGTYVSLTTPVPFGEAQIVAGDDTAKTVQVLADTFQYMVKVYSNETTESFRDGCHCRHENCAFWATIGEWSLKATSKKRPDDNFNDGVFPRDHVTETNGIRFGFVSTFVLTSMSVIF